HHPAYCWLAPNRGAVWFDDRLSVRHAIYRNTSRGRGQLADHPDLERCSRQYLPDHCPALFAARRPARPERAELFPMVDSDLDWTMGLSGPSAANPGLSTRLGVFAGPVRVSANCGRSRTGVADLGSVPGYLYLDRDCRGVYQRHWDWDSGVGAPEQSWR